MAKTANVEKWGRSTARKRYADGGATSGLGNVPDDAPGIGPVSGPDQLKGFMNLDRREGGVEQRSNMKRAEDISNAVPRRQD